jgi:FixJ family two-component response regulator
VTADRANYTVFVVDDDAALARALARILRIDGWSVETFESAEAFLERWKSNDLGCLVLDVNLPGLDGLALQARLRDAGESLPIVFLTGRGDIPMSVRAIKAGAADFLMKPVDGEALDVAIRGAIDQHIAARRLRADADVVRRRLEQLTPREREVLDGMVAGKLNKQIAFDLGIVEQTVKYHRARIMARMQAKSVPELMHIVARAESAAALTKG